MFILHFEKSCGIESLSLAGTCPVPPKRDRWGRGAQYEGNFFPEKPRPNGVGGELHFAYISGNFPSIWGFLMGVYLFCEKRRALKIEGFRLKSSCWAKSYLRSRPQVVWSP